MAFRINDLGEGAEHALISIIISIMWSALTMVIVSFTTSEYLWLIIIGIIGVTVVLSFYELQYLLCSTVGFIIGYGTVVITGLHVAPSLFITAIVQLVAIIVIKYHIYKNGR